jgi:predicted membrane channel-forming protein YqfA (hemolysin III family)
LPLSTHPNFSNSRKATASYIDSLKSVLRIHNETCNIWTHILAAVGFTTWLVIYYVYPHGDRDDIAVYIYFISVILCFVFSFM